MNALNSFLPWYKSFSSVSSTDLTKLYLERAHKALLDEQLQLDYHEAMVRMYKKQITLLNKQVFPVNIKATVSSKDSNFME